MRIDVFHDTACPWCRIGKAHLKQAIQQWEATGGDPVEVHYHPFFLNPSIPEGGYPFREYMNAKGGGRVPMETWFDRPRAMGEQAGLVFNFEQIEHAPNTTLSHQVILLAPDDQQEPLMDAIYAAYFEHGQNIGDIEILLDIAEQHDLNREALRARLEAGEKRDQIFAAYDEAQQIGVQGVPFFIVGQRYAFSGAQPPETIVQVMRDTQAEQRSANVTLE